MNHLVDYTPKYEGKTLRYVLNDPDAVGLTRRDESDVGAIVTIIGRTDEREEDEVGAINNFETGITVAAAPGHCCVIYPTPELEQHGYTILGAQYIETEEHEPLVLRLYKFKDLDDLELPFEAAVIVHQNIGYGYYAKVKALETSTLAGDISVGKEEPKKKKGGLPTKEISTTKKKSTRSTPFA